MNRNIFKIALALCFVCIIYTQTPPNWGGNPRYTVKVNMLNDDPATRWNFTYFYDWNQKV